MLHFLEKLLACWHYVNALLHHPWTESCPPTMKRVGMTFVDMDVVGINEAFAAEVLGCLAGLWI